MPWPVRQPARMLPPFPTEDERAARMLQGLRRGAALALVLATAGGMVACGETGSQKPSSAPAATSPAASNAPAGDPADEPTSSRAAVLRLWELIQAGAVLNAVLLYDKPVRDAAGVSNVAGALASIQPDVTGPPQILKAESTPAGSLVTIRPGSGPSASQTYSYLLRQTGGRWQIVYDSRLAQALPAYVVAATQQAIDPGSGPNKTSPRAQAAGQRVVEKYRAAALRATPLDTRRALSPQSP